MADRINNPIVWGQTWWDAMHMYTLYSPVKPTASEQDKSRAYIQRWADDVPCESECRPHIQELLRNHALDVSSREALVASGVWLHNQVNQRLGRPADYTVEQLWKRLVERPSAPWYSDVAFVERRHGQSLAQARVSIRAWALAAAIASAFLVACLLLPRRKGV